MVRRCAGGVKKAHDIVSADFNAPEITFEAGAEKVDSSEFDPVG
jgi:hypothetical protein